jgi:hypothetical protein
MREPVADDDPVVGPRAAGVSVYSGRGDGRHPAGTAGVDLADHGLRALACGALGGEPCG